MPAVEDALRADIDARALPSPAARALDHKLGGPPHERRYTAPSYELSADGRTFAIPGFNPVEAYEAALANFGLTRRAKPESVEQLLAWASRAAGHGRGDRDHAGRSGQDCAPSWPASATPIPAGADFYWTAR